jgi:16S rRNA U516 pseudouridylate synthase RsuA-like enzyme
MIRTQIQLTEEQARELKRIAAERGISVAALIREAVAKTLAADDRPARRRRALAAVGRFGSGRRDVSAERDRYLADDFAS